eukprot:TRINITY_DN2566_c0_g4_i1.p1 TRINITY_DN2566_c0_g4~~TRINITY_DN2566_c0_g4_i1.p1  ORF type:complete len:150 (-),score=13.13 TRINITY_DN2566_c0_g4_i1:341-790(-)
MSCEGLSCYNEMMWRLSQLSEGPTCKRAVIQLDDLSGLSPRWLPFLGQHPDYYPVSERVFLSAPAIDRIVSINCHGAGDLTGVFPEASFFNHCSNSNCEYVMVKKADGSRVGSTLGVVTSRPVKKGEELTVRYAAHMAATNKWGIPAGC